MKKIYLFIVTLLFILPLNVFADSIDKFLTDININDDGSISIKELITLDGDYNGLLREILYKNSNTLPFDGSKTSFGGSDIYNGSRISNLKVFSVVKHADFMHLDKENQFQEVDYASSGETGVFTKELTTNGYNLKIFNPSSYNKAFYLEYDVHDVVINHLDISEIGWNLFNDNNTEDINYYEAMIHLPKDDPSMRIWGHGPLNGNIDRVDDKTVMLTYKNLYQKNPVDFRMTFDNTIVNSNKKTNVKALNYIMEIEKERAETANNLREKNRMFRKCSLIATSVWVVLVIINLVYVYIKYDKEYKKTFFNEYYRQIPEELEIGEVEYLMGHAITDKSFSTTILSIIEKRVLDVRELDNNNYLLKYNEANFSKLSEPEKIVFDLIINDIGNNGEVTLDAIKKYGKNLTNANNFSAKFNDFKENSMNLANKKNYYLNVTKIKIFSILFSLLGAIFLLLDVSFNDGHCALIIIITIIVSVIYYSLFIKRSKEGNLAYQKWSAFKKFLIDFSRFNEKELPEVILWERLLVYGNILGVANKLERDMKIKIREVYPDNTVNTYLPNYLLNMHIYNSINSTVNTLTTVSRNAIAQSTNSSSSGFGGGMSSGGGSFGGGGSVGRF